APAGGKGRFRRTWRKIRAVLPRRQGRRLARGAHGSPGARGGRCPPPADAAFRLRAGGILMGSIIWLASYPKSGNTWLRAFLHNLFRNPDKPLPLNQLGGGGLTTSEAGLPWYRLFDSRDPAEWSQEEVDAMRLKAHEAIAASVQGNIFCKIHGASFVLRGRPTVNQKVSSGAIYVVRNPL